MVLEEWQLLNVRTVGALTARQIMGSILPLEAYAGAPETAGAAAERRARALAHLVPEVSASYPMRWTVADTGEKWAYRVEPPEYMPTVRLRTLAANRRRLGDPTSAAVYERAAALVESGSLGIPSLVQAEAPMT